MQFPMIHTDHQGETHFGTQEVPDAVTAFGPPPNPIGLMTDFGPATNMFVFSIPAGTAVPSHTAPHPYVSIVLSGTVEIVASDGEARRFGPGGLLFCNDLSGQGHLTRAITDAVAAFVNRPSA
jgi:quercetin dioxygenase-like cupin family protein